jgi:hypothetical protein
MFDFCPNCGVTINQEQVEGRMLVCGQCRKDIGFVGAVARIAVSETQERINAGTAARCPVCRQAVEVKTAGMVASLVPHFGPKDKRKICPGSGKPAAVDPVIDKKTPRLKDLSAHMTRDTIKVISVTHDADPRIEVLTLEYLDKSERVRIQIEALREMMGADFHLRDYPPSLHKPHLAVWGNAEACVVAQKHERGGYQSIVDAEITVVLADLRQRKELFFAS